MAEAKDMNNFLDIQKQFQGMELAPGSKIFLKDPERGLKIKIEKPKDGMVKRFKNSFIKRDKTTSEGFKPPNPTPPVPQRRHGANQIQEEYQYAYLPLNIEARNRDPSVGYEVPQREPANIPDSMIVQYMDEDIYESTEYINGQVNIKEALYSGPKGDKQLPGRGSPNPWNVDRDGYDHVVDDDHAQTSEQDRNSDAPPSPGSNTEYDSQREQSFGEDLDEEYKRLRQDYQNAKLDTDCPTPRQKEGVPLPIIKFQVPVPDYWMS